VAAGAGRRSLNTAVRSPPRTSGEPGDQFSLAQASGRPRSCAFSISADTREGGRRHEGKYPRRMLARALPRGAAIHPYTSVHGGGGTTVTDMRPVARDGCPVNRDAPAISQRLRVRGRAIDRWKANGVSYTLVPVRTAEGTDFLFGSRSKINTSSGISRYTHTHTHRSRPLRQSRMPRRRRWA